jgi:hypothetical protein
MSLVEISYGLEQVSRQWQLKLKSQLEIWVKKNERTIALVQSYRMRNLFPNPVYVDDTLLAISDVNLLLEKRSSCPQDSIRMFSVKCLSL